METAIKTNCSNCRTQLTETDIYCSECGFPENGSQAEKNKYHHSIKLKKDVLVEGRKKLKSVKILLYVIAGFNFLFGIYYLTDASTFANAITNFLAAAIFLGCVIWVNNQPLTGILVAFVFWILLQLSVVLVDPLLLFQGIILKVIFIGIFVKGIASAKDAKKYTAQLKEMKVM